MNAIPADFEGEGRSSRRLYAAGAETWWFPVIDIVQNPTDSKAGQLVGTATSYGPAGAQPAERPSATLRCCRKKV